MIAKCFRLKDSAERQKTRVESNHTAGLCEEDITFTLTDLTLRTGL